MNERLQRLSADVVVDEYPICIEKLKIVLETLKESAGQPQILRRAKCLASVLDRMPIFIEAGELIVGNAASQPMGMEIDAEYGNWSQAEIDSLKQDCYTISPEDEVTLQSLYAQHTPRTLVSAVGEFVGDDERLWPFMQSGVMLPPWKSKTGGSGGGYAQSGLGLGPGFYLMGVDIPRVIHGGVNKIIQEAEDELHALRFTNSDAPQKACYLKSVIIANQALVRFANRFAHLASDLAQDEPDSNRRTELTRIAEICRRVPANPARTFHEGMQAFWFLFLVLNPSPTAAAGRFDQYMYPLYRDDIAAGRITREEALELLACLRIKDMQLNRVSGANNRKKNAGMAKWHNWTIGGQTVDGHDATNEMTYLVLEAAQLMPLPHHTITLRVHEDTPDKLMQKALEVVRTGLGMPAFVGDKSYIQFFVGNGVALEDARDYILTGCLDANIPTKSRTAAIGMFIVPLVFEIFLHDGIDPNTGMQVGPSVGDIGRLKTYDEFLAAFKKHLTYFMALAAEKNNIELSVLRENFPDPLRSSLMHDGIKSGKDILDRTMPFENGAVLNPVGMINLADSLAAIKKLVYDEACCTIGQMKAALDANWKAHELLQKRCLSVPKYGNGDIFVDAIAADLYEFWADTTATFSTLYGGTHKPTAISITSHQPGGALTGATPDGRGAREIFADGTVSPMQGVDTHGPTRVLASAMRIDQDPYQATLLNMKLHPSALKSDSDLQKIAALIKTYFSQGGKHIQFNVVNRETLVDAQVRPYKHRNLAVRVAGYSAYFVQLGKGMQDEVIKRTEHGTLRYTPSARPSKVSDKPATTHSEESVEVST